MKTVVESFFGIDLKNKKIEYLKPGSTVIPVTTLDSVGNAVANALLKPEATKNRVLYICNKQKTQKELADLAKEALGGLGWQSEDLDTQAAFEAAILRLEAGQVDMRVIADIIRFSVSTPGYVTELEKTDNDLLGVKTMSNEEIMELIRQIAREMSVA